MRAATKSGRWGTSVEGTDAPKSLSSSAASRDKKGVRDAELIAELRGLLPHCLLPDQVRLAAQLAHGLRSLRAGRARSLPWDHWLSRARRSVAAREERGRLRSRVVYPEALPISARQEEIVAAIRRHPVLVVAGETGSGKTTQIPKMCLEAGLGARARIGCTQPRRVAALSISRRIAEELGGEWGREVGCKIRFTDRTRHESAIKVMTDGMLLAELQGDPMLSEYEAIILDEAHERSLNIDFLLGCLKLLLVRRDDLKLVITSATIDTPLFAQAFGGAPVIEVSGRVYPVDVRYRPPATEDDEPGTAPYTESAAAAVEELLAESAEGDVLVFMPGERDIRETCEVLEKRQRARIDVVPLFGRLSGDEQQRVFAPGPRRRVVVATNVAETSLTVPRIRYVVDPGLARISRYHAGTRSRRLPIEPIAQSSANQRMGRCGRLSGGICVRLFSAEDFAARRPFAEPEIQRCNLADVILRLKASQLGEIETFPFVEPPAPSAIRGAYALLQELGALDDERGLTRLGRDLARLPLDPSIGRMVLEARAENCLAEVVVIAAGLSIQDPRERPFDQRDAASAAHRRFQRPGSDFLTLLNIWQAYHDTWESLRTQSQLRKFCKAHFLSYLRMREWVDLHNQLEATLAELEGFQANRDPAAESAIHRAILCGLVGHVARREDRNVYRATGGRLVHVFPGSGLFLKPQPNRPGKKTPAPTVKVPKESQPAWVIAGELVETSRPFARTLAGIDPEWVIELAPHIVRTTHSNPRWDGRQGRVVATEHTTLRGLQLRERTVGYEQVNATEATEIFIRTALVEEAVLEESTAEGQQPESGRAAAAGREAARTGGRHSPGPTILEPVRALLAHNRQLRAKIELWQTRLPARVVPDLDEALFDFYRARLAGVASVVALNRQLKADGEGRSLRATPADLLGDHAAAFDANAFPDRIRLGDEAVPVRYAYAPGAEEDGLTVRLAAPLAEAVDPALLDWAVPALREARVLALLQALPKSLRRPLMPLPETARRIAAGIEAAAGRHLEAMSALVRREFGVVVPVESWAIGQLPDHLRPRVEIVGRDDRPVAAGRDLRALRETLRRQPTGDDNPAWEQAVRQWERYDLRTWSVGDLPEQVLVAEVAGFPVHAVPGLHVESGVVNLRLFRRREEAQAHSPYGVARLVEVVLERELAWLRKDLRELRKACDLYVTLGSGDELVETAWENIRRHYFTAIALWPLTADGFTTTVDRVRGELRGLLPRFQGWLQTILNRRQEALLCPRPFPGMRAEIDALTPPRFLRHVPFVQLPHLGRHLQALCVRAGRAALDPARDVERARRMEPFLRALRRHREAAGRVHAVWVQWNRLRWLIEEFKVSVFAQELGTAERVSEKRLEAVVADLDRIAAPSEEAAMRPPPRPGSG